MNGKSRLCAFKLYLEKQHAISSQIARKLVQLEAALRAGPDRVRSALGLCISSHLSTGPACTLAAT
ncbi:hypothetical protein F511_38441 [Dorcoceras hygrometricum]|uniref:Uncharacterized protein n=1 Tax=Dorcoceras hygrometricum TaxID=472368 RepID=A0A2Z7D502_9LAMI|nr:hypothetical protein F511_38441 [Dorcoceras hygrometricum]